MKYFRADLEAKKHFDQFGYLLVKNLFSSEEVGRLSRFARNDAALVARATNRADAQGGVTTLSLDNSLSNDPYSAIVRSARIVENMSLFLEDEVYHYHHKMMLKEPKVGGAWEWHQDYGYWYNFGCLFPTMASCYVAVDPAIRENGCLQIISGSHRMGRIDHGKVGGQTGADLERVEAALRIMPLQYVEMDPGDGLFFHGNLLHRSDQNVSERPRWALIACYNTKSNDPYKPGRHPNYSPLEVLSDEQVLSHLC